MSMCALTILNDVAAAIHKACSDLPLVETVGPSSPAVRDRVRKQRKHDIYDLQSVVVFQQLWGSTALGFGGIGGQAITTCNVIIVEGHTGAHAVYFGSRLAYVIARPNDQFFTDVKSKGVCEVSRAKSRYEK